MVVVLQRVEGDSEPLVSIQFSDEANAYLMGNNGDCQSHDSGWIAAAVGGVSNIEVETAECRPARCTEVTASVTAEQRLRELSEAHNGGSASPEKALGYIQSLV